ncbi:MAG: porin family protein [Bacteroidetes bacterium]|nr:porin family protein [Bacteroidota bacterium]
MKTKDLIFAILASTLLMISLDTFSQGWSVGARFGGDFASLSNFSKEKSSMDQIYPNTDYTRKIHPGFQGGFFGAYLFNKFIGIQAEMIFDSKGETVTYNRKNAEGETGKITNNGTINYFTIPILFKGCAAIGKFFSIYGILGPYVGIGLGGRGKITGNGEDKTRSVVFTSETGTDDNVHAQRIDVGLTIGVEPGFKAGPGIILLDLRYNYGFTDVQNPGDHKGDNYYPRCNRSFGISAGYVYAFGKK